MRKKKNNKKTIYTKDKRNQTKIFKINICILKQNKIQINEKQK